MEEQSLHSGRVLLSQSPHRDWSTHTDVIFVILFWKTYLSNSTRLVICFVLRGMECILVFISLGEGEPSAGGEGSGGRVKPCNLLAGGGDRWFPFSPVTNPDGKTPKGATECHTWGRTFQCPNVSQLRPGLDTTGGSSHGPGDLSFLSTFFFPSSKLSLSPPLLYTFTFFPSLSCSSSLPLPVHSTCLKKKTIFGGGAGGGLLSCLLLGCCRFES